VPENASTGIKSFGAYVPKRRLQRAAIAAAHAWSFPSLKALGKGERSMCSWDEDVITMAVEAGRDCLRNASASSLSVLTLASTTAPYADLNNAVLVAAGLRLPSSASAGDVGGSTRAGLTAVIRACQTTVEGDSLIVASEKRSGKPGSAQEMQYGCGAGAVRIGSGDELIAKFLGAETVSVPFIGNFRAAGEVFDYGWEERWIRDEGLSKIVPAAVTRLLARLTLNSERVAHFGIAGGPPGSDRLVAKALGLTADRVIPDLQGTIGDTGTAHPLLLLVAALERAKPGDVMVIASFAQGCEVVAFEMLQSASAAERRGLAGSIAQRIEETAYLKLLSFDGHITLDWGMRGETDSKTALTQLYRSADQILGFVGGQCRQCQTVQFPRMPACVNCGAIDSQEPFALADIPAKAATYTADWLMYTPSPPLYVGLVQFDVGARLLMEIVDVGPAGLEVGTPLNMVFRIKERDQARHFDRYFWKATPAG
jgi:3-hydroxy-3-methylglutaryl CoA synthase